MTSGSAGKQLDSRSSQHQTAEHELAALAAVMGDRNPQRREPNRTGQQQKSSDRTTGRLWSRSTAVACQAWVRPANGSAHHTRVEPRADLNTRHSPRPLSHCSYCPFPRRTLGRRELPVLRAPPSDAHGDCVQCHSGSANRSESHVVLLAVEKGSGHPCSWGALHQVGAFCGNCPPDGSPSTQHPAAVSEGRLLIVTVRA